jgi:hypothetical protein
MKISTPFISRPLFPVRPSTPWEKIKASPSCFLARWLYEKRGPPLAVEPVENPIAVVCVSDTHNLQPQLPDGDLLLHAGDLTEAGTFKELQEQLDWLNNQPHRHKVVIAGKPKNFLSMIMWSYQPMEGTTTASSLPPSLIRTPCMPSRRAARLATTSIGAP